MEPLSVPPQGPVALCFADVEDSTPLQERGPELYVDLVATYRRLVRAAFDSHQGYEVGTDGDGFFYVFPGSSLALRAAAEAQRALAAERWPPGLTLRARMGVHSGAPVLTSEGYVGLDVVRAHRVMAAGYGGQVLVSGRAREEVLDPPLPGVSFVDLGLHHLKGLSQPEQLFQMNIEGLAAHFPPPRTLTEVSLNLPIQPTALLGRERELDELHSLLSRRELRIITVTGPGGTGKTRLALEAAAQSALQFSNGVCFVPLASVQDPAGFVPAVARAVDLAGTGVTIEMLASHLAGRNLLLLLDNFEQLLPAATDVARLLSAAPLLKVLATSREPLRLRGETEMPLGPLAVPSPGEGFDAIAISPAVRLFVERAASVRPGFTLTADSAGHVAHLCRRLDGLPLAIELVAARSRLLSPEALVDRLSGLFQLASGGARDLPERHQSLRAAIAWSYDLLPPDQQAVFRHLAVFVGSFTMEAASAVVPEELRGLDLFDRLDALVSKSLIRVAESQGAEVRFTMFEALREFGLMMLRQLDEFEDANTRHLMWFRSVVLHSFTNADQAVVVETVDADADNVRAALAWALTSPDRAILGLSLAASANAFFWQRSSDEGADWLERLLAVAPERPSGTRSHALSRLAFHREYIASAEEVIALAEQSLESLPDRHKISPGLAIALNALGDALANGGHAERAREASQEAVSVARQCGEPRLIGLTLWPLGKAAFACGDLDGAWAAWTESAQILSNAGEHLMAGTPLCSLAQLAVLRGQSKDAEALIGQGVQLIRSTGDVPRTAEFLALHARTRLAAGDSLGAANSLRESLEVLRNAAAGMRPTGPLAATSEWCAANGRWEDAVILIAAARAIARGAEWTWIDDRQVQQMVDEAGKHLDSHRLVTAASAGARLGRTEAIEHALKAVARD